MAWLGHDPLAYLRGRIDEVDDELAVLLARRMALTAAVQDHKEVGGHAGRDPEREAEIVQRMAAHVPGLDRHVLATGDAHRDRGEPGRLGARNRVVRGGPVDGQRGCQNAGEMLTYAGDLPQNDQAQHQPGVGLGTAVSTQSSGKG